MSGQTTDVSHLGQGGEGAAGGVGGVSGAAASVAQVIHKPQGGFSICCKKPMMHP